MSMFQRLTRLNANHTSWPPGGKKGPWSYVYNENRVPSEEKRESCEGTHFDIPVGESCGKCKNACNAKVEISTVKGGSRASTKIPGLRMSAQTLRLCMFQRSIRVNENQIESEEKTIETAKEGISSYI